MKTLDKIIIGFFGICIILTTVFHLEKLVSITLLGLFLSYLFYGSYRMYSDKRKHFWILYPLTLAICLLGFVIKSNTLLIAIAIGLIIAGGKELYDWISKKGTPEVLDFIAGCYGILAGILTYWIIILITQKK